MRIRGGGPVRLESDDVAEQLPFIPPVITHLARPVDQFDSFHPLRDGNFILARKVVEMLDKAGHHGP